MNTKLFYILLFITSISYAQIPTNGLVANYQFNNSSSTTDSNASGTNLSQTGTASIASTDRFGNTDALSLNGDVLYRADMPTTSEDLTLNFWIKTTSSSASGEIIINDTNDDSIGAFARPFSSSRQGYMVYIQGGKIKVKVASRNGGNLYVPANTHHNDILVNDGEWHHVSVYLKEHFIPINPTSTVNYVGHDIKITIDNQIDPAIQTNVSANQHSGTLSGSIHGVGNFHIGDKPTPSNPLNFYTSEIDDLLVYDRELTAGELTQITNIGGYCTTPQFGGLASFTSTNTNNTISFSLPDTDMYGVAYHLASEPFSQAIIINGLSNANTSGVILANLNENSLYSVYLRKQCTNTTDWSTPRTIKTERPTSTTRLYVNGSATGANNGLSWADAYTDANDAFINAADNDEIWIAAGTYTAHATDPTVSYTVNKENLKIYGGFVGTETTIKQRDFRMNVTILSGDLLGDDNGSVNLNDNSYNVLNVQDNGANIDGITISDGNATNGGSNSGTGAGIFKARPVNSLTVKNCIIKNNYASYAGGIIAEFQSIGGTLDIENCVFDNNTGRFGSALYAQTRNGGTFAFNVSNSLFSNNEAKDIISTGNGYAGSAGFFQANSSASTANVKLTNNTYVNNKDTGTHSSMTNLTRGTIGANETSGTLNLEVANCLFYNNTIDGGTTANAITGLNSALALNITVTNSIDEGNFSTLNSANLTGTSSSDPLFTSTTDFTLQTGSLAIDTGDNSKVPAGLTTDLLGNQRIHNTTVDMGAYEFGSSILGIDNVNKIEGLKMYPNPTKGNLTFDLQEQIKTIELYNLQGQVVKMFTSKKVDINSVTKGIYMVKITTESGKVAIKKIVKN